MRVEEYRLLLTYLAAQISMLLADDERVRSVFTSECEAVRENAKLAEWMEWYYRE